MLGARVAFFRDVNAKNSCSNCKTRRRPIQRGGMCSKCRYWHEKMMSIKRECLSSLPKNRASHSALLRYRMREAKRVLEEYAWREYWLHALDPDAACVESLVYAIAGECRSEIGFAIHSWLSAQTAEARRLFFAILLAIVENIPARRPRLHTLTPPCRGNYCDPWSDWALEPYRSSGRTVRQNSSPKC